MSSKINLFSTGSKGILEIKLKQGNSILNDEKKLLTLYCYVSVCVYFCIFVFFLSFLHFHIPM